MQRSKERRYSITSSAVASNLSGMVSPSALAVLRLKLKLCRRGCTIRYCDGIDWPSPIREPQGARGHRQESISRYAMPDVPAAIEFGVLPGYDVTTWYGVFGPPGMSAPVVERLNKTLLEIIADEKVRARLVALGVVVHGSGAAEFGTFMEEEYKRWDAVREAAGIAQQ
jgi:hypothetical protein